jgi:hypothetical protein
VDGQEFVVPLTTLANEGKGVLSPGQVDLIFSRVTPLHAIHEALLDEFRRGTRIANPLRT